MLWIVTVLAIACVLAVAFAVAFPRVQGFPYDLSANAGSNETNGESVSAAPTDLDGPDSSSGDHKSRSIDGHAITAHPAAAGDAASGGANRGVIRGKIVLAAGATMPRSWTLSIRPSEIVSGAEPADVRTLAFANGEETFRVEDLPLGGYTVRAVALGLNAIPAQVLLARGSENQFVTLGLLPSGSISGTVLEADGAPADGVTVTLESHESKERRMLDTDAAGAFRFFDVLDGAYTLYIGRPEAPLLSPDELAFRAPQMTLPTRTLQAIGSARVIVRDESGATVAGAVVTGFASPAGVVDVKSDEHGVALVRHLPPGRYRLFARNDDGRRGTAVLNVVAGQEAQVDLKLRAD